MRYETGISITNGWIVLVNGPYPPGEWNDLKIAKACLVHHLDDGEKYVADKGYQDGDKFSVTPSRYNFSIMNI